MQINNFSAARKMLDLPMKVMYKSDAAGLATDK